MEKDSAGHLPCVGTPSPGSRRLRFLLALCLGIAYCVACFLPAIQSDEILSGSECLIFGSWGWNTLPPWSANPVFLFGLLLLAAGRLRLATILGSVSALLALTTRFVLVQEKLLAGYYVWQLCLFAAAVSAGYLWMMARPGHKESRH
jgi:hypothetical protein